MQLAKLHTLSEHLRSDEQLCAYASILDVFYKHNVSWFREDETIVSEEAQISLLDHVLNKGADWRERKSAEAYFPIPSISCVVKALFTSPSQKRTRTKYNEGIIRCLKHAQDAFDAAHDDKTGLLNDKAFANKLQDALKPEPMRGGEVAETIRSGRSDKLATLLALDADHFKQVNDSYGHLYGDVVIKCLAMRLERVGKRMAIESNGSIHVHIARPGGEEYLVLIHGTFDSQNAIRFAEAFREEISKEPLPSEKEWGMDILKDFIATLKLPPQNERIVTVSVGVASAPPSPTADIKGAASSLRNKADLALYFAKSGGRNRSREFRDIANQCGTILLHHTEADVVTINLGAQVGITPGQEFHVFHPDFSGLTPFIHSDGRTRKILGVFPRHPIGRVVVFDVQREVSFCHVAEPRPKSPFPVGSHLELVPLGSISHLIPAGASSAYRVKDLPTAEDLSSEIDNTIRKGKEPTAVVFALRNEDRLKQERGEAFINEALAKLFQAIRDEFPQLVKIGQTQKTELALVSSGIGHRDVRAKVDSVLRRAATLTDGLASFSAGIYNKEIASHEPHEGDKSRYDDKHSLLYARYSSMRALSADISVDEFNCTTVVGILNDSRETGMYRRGVEDYKALRKVGVECSRVENQIALCYLEMRPSELKPSLEALDRAISLEPKSPWFHANKGYVLYEMGQRLDAYAAFLKARRCDDKITLDGVYLPPLALSGYEAYCNGQYGYEQQSLVRLLHSAREHLSDKRANPYLVEIDKALQSLGVGG